jgi:hypothetical protein
MFGVSALGGYLLGREALLHQRRVPVRVRQDG